MSYRRPTTLYSGIFPSIFSGWYSYQRGFPLFSTIATVYDFFEQPDYWYYANNLPGYPPKIDTTGHLYYQLPTFWPDVDLSTPPPSNGITIDWQRDELRQFYQDKVIARYPEEPLAAVGRVTDPDYWGNIKLIHNKTGAERYKPAIGWYMYGGVYENTKYLVWNSKIMFSGILPLLVPFAVMTVMLEASVHRLPRKQ